MIKKYLLLVVACLGMQPHLQPITAPSSESVATVGMLCAGVAYFSILFSLFETEMVVGIYEADTILEKEELLTQLHKPFPARSFQLRKQVSSIGDRILWLSGVTMMSALIAGMACGASNSAAAQSPTVAN